jgi:hypothetical protein
MGKARRAALCIRARAATGLSQEEFARWLGRTRNVAKKIESPLDEAELNHRQLELVPDGYVDVVLAELAKVRAGRGFARRVWMPAPEVEHASEDDRARALTLALFDVLRAHPQQADHQTHANLLRVAIGRLLEALAFRLREGAR